jgi:hypothetical protein
MGLMRARNTVRIGATWTAGILSLVVTVFGLYWAMSIDARFNPVLSILFCALPMASFPVFLIRRWLPKIAVLQAAMGVAFLAVYAALNWRTCASMGDCSGVRAVVWLTFTTMPVLVFFGAAICGLIAARLRDKA